MRVKLVCTSTTEQLYYRVINTCSVESVKSLLKLVNSDHIYKKAIIHPISFMFLNSVKSSNVAEGEDLNEKVK